LDDVRRGEGAARRRSSTRFDRTAAHEFAGVRTPRWINIHAVQNVLRLKHLLQSEHPAIRIADPAEPEVLACVRAATDDIGLPRYCWSLPRGLYEDAVKDAAAEPDTQMPADALVKLSQLPGPFCAVLLDLGQHLRERDKDAPLIQRLLREVIFKFESTGSHLVLLDADDCLPPAIQQIATPFELIPPDEKKLDEIVRATVRDLHDRHRVRAQVDVQTLRTIVRNLKGLTARQARRVIAEAVLEDKALDHRDIKSVMEAKRRLLQDSGLLQYVDVPVSLDEIGGLKNLKAWLGRRTEALSDKAAQFGIRPPRGVLMLGVQGAGKSLSAKAVATAWQRPLLRLDVGSLFDKYIGESERRLRDTLKQAERMAPIILWIDEIEKAFASAAAQSNDGGVSKRMFGTLLTWMQDHAAPVFLIATANDIEALPPELLRKGRFDEIFFVDLPQIDARHQICSIHLKKRGRDPKKFDLDALAEVTTGFSGAEIEQAITAALLDAFSAGEDLETRHVLTAVKSSPPLSVTMAERIEGLRAWAKGRCVGAD
jgi:ATP-dependent 26S proteasome regulatory subunit